MTTSSNNKTASCRIGLGRRLLVMFYDGFLLVGVWFVAGIPFVMFVGPNTIQTHVVVRFIFQGYLLLATYIFFAWFWTHGGQTLGMRTWKVKLCGLDDRPVSWRQATGRYLASLLSLACLGLGFLWVLFDRDKLAWHDRLSSTHLVRTSS